MKIKILAFVGCISLLIYVSCNYTNYVQGQQLYESNCATCHMSDGSGVSELYPALNQFKNSMFKVSDMPCIIRNGLQREGSLIEMAGLKHLSDVEINNIVNFIVNDMNKMGLEQSIEQTSHNLNACKN